VSEGLASASEADDDACQGMQVTTAYTGSDRVHLCGYVTSHVSATGTAVCAILQFFSKLSWRGTNLYLQRYRCMRRCHLQI
jgi:hypothetical protein